MTRRYYLPELPLQGGSVSLTDAEFQHAVRVMRVQVDQEIELFDGRGKTAEATITEITRRECHCKSAATIVDDREPAREVHLGIALPKPDRARELIERLTELGVQSITPITAARCQRPPSASLIGKLRRGVIEACKQCQRNVLMTVADPADLAEFFSSRSSGDHWIAHPTGTPINQAVGDCGPELTALIGPEGGWTDDEVTSATEAGYRPIGFGKRIYRIETAAAYLTARLIDQ